MNQAVFITGSSTGIGRAIALHLVANGFQVFAGVRKQADGETLQQLAKTNLTPVIIDVCDDQSIAHAAAELEAAVGEQGLYALINNAGVSLCSPLEYATREHMDRQLQTNFYGMVLTTGALLPLLRKAQGRIINISSGAGKFSTPTMGVYSATKFAVEGMSDALRVELRSAGIKVIVVEPGFVASDIHGKNSQDMDKVLAELPAAGLDYYGDAIKKFKATNEKMSLKATPAEQAGSVVLKALTVNKPKARYTVGPDAKFLSIFGSLMSDKLKDRLAGYMVGL